MVTGAPGAAPGEAPGEANHFSLAVPPEVFSLSEVVLAAHRELAQKLRSSESSVNGEERDRMCRLLRSFVPGIVRSDLTSSRSSRRSRRERGALLFADASGFTAPPGVRRPESRALARDDSAVDGDPRAYVRRR